MTKYNNRTLCDEFNTERFKKEKAKKKVIKFAI